MQRRKFLFAFAAFAALALGQSSAQAAFSGNLTLTATTAVNNGTLSGQTSFTFTNFLTGAGALVTSVNGAFGTPAPPNGGVTGGTTYLTNTLNIGNVASLVGFSLTNSTFGSFTSTASDSFGNVSTILSSSGNDIEIYLTGNYVGLPNNAASTPGSLRISIVYNGGPTAQVGFALAVPPVSAVPEPASVVMLGLGLVGFGGVALRRRSAK